MGKFSHASAIDPTKSLNAMDEVDYAERVPLMKTTLVPNDPEQSVLCTEFNRCF